MTSQGLESNDCVATFVASIAKSDNHFILIFSRTHNKNCAENCTISIFPPLILTLLSLFSNRREEVKHVASLTAELT